MKRLLLFLALVPCLALSQNPILPGFYPDPSIVRAGEYYYIVNSSFHYFPGVPVHRSTDLRHWELIGNVLDRDSQLPLDGATSWQGIYAPTIRYNNGTFYMVTTNVSLGKNFFVTATDPAGPWSEPIWLEQGGIDPSFYFEGNHCYMVSNPDNAITLCEIDPVTGRRISPSKVLWKGTGSRFPEGPHIYRKDGWYYLLISEGGTEMGHKLTIARSRNIDGPYKPGPSNPIFTHASLAAQNSPIQGTGHGDFVETPDGSWYVVMLAYRRFGGDFHHLGRETFIAPVTWESGWPVINGGKPLEIEEVAPASAAATAPGCAASAPGDVAEAPGGMAASASGDLAEAPGCDTSAPGDVAEAPSCVAASAPGDVAEAPSGAAAVAPCCAGAHAAPFTGPEWLHIQNPELDNYTRIGSALVLRGNGSSLTSGPRPTYLGRRQESVSLCLDATVTALTDSTVAGITVYQIDGGHLDLGFESDTTLALRYRIKSIDHLASSRPLTPSCPHHADHHAALSADHHAPLSCSHGDPTPGATVYLRVTSDGERYWFYWSRDGVEYEELGSVETAFVSTEVVGGFTGVTLGMYCTRGLAAFTRFDLKP